MTKSFGRKSIHLKKGPIIFHVAKAQKKFFISEEMLHLFKAEKTKGKRILKTFLLHFLNFFSISLCFSFAFSQFMCRTEWKSRMEEMCTSEDNENHQKNTFKLHAILKVSVGKKTLVRPR